MLNELKKSVEGQWSSVRERMASECERLASAQEEWEAKAKSMELSLTAKVDAGVASLALLHQHQGNRDIKVFRGANGAEGGLMTPPSLRATQIVLTFLLFDTGQLQLERLLRLRFDAERLDGFIESNDDQQLSAGRGGALSRDARVVCDLGQVIDDILFFSGCLNIRCEQKRGYCRAFILGCGAYHSSRLSSLTLKLRANSAWNTIILIYSALQVSANLA